MVHAVLKYRIALKSCTFENLFFSRPWVGASLPQMAREDLQSEDEDRFSEEEAALFIAEQDTESESKGDHSFRSHNVELGNVTVFRSSLVLDGNGTPGGCSETVGEISYAMYL